MDGSAKRQSLSSVVFIAKCLLKEVTSSHITENMRRSISVTGKWVVLGTFKSDKFLNK